MAPVVVHLERKDVTGNSALAILLVPDIGNVHPQSIPVQVYHPPDESTPPENREEIQRSGCDQLGIQHWWVSVPVDVAAGAAPILLAVSGGRVASIRQSVIDLRLERTRRLRRTGSPTGDVRSARGWPG